MDVKDVKKLIDAAKAADLTELVYENGETRVTIRRGEPAPAAAPAAAVPAPAPTAPGVGAVPVPAAEPAPAPDPAADAAPPSHLVEVTAPIVGTFYAAPAPDAPAYVKVGDHVQAGSVLCIIEAMKLMNEIEAETSGTVAEVLVRNEEPVEYGQVLFRIDPD
jgi:acetyl-CoA carboxylase biotin carboxyl carrier protein